MRAENRLSREAKRDSTVGPEKVVRLSQSGVWDAIREVLDTNEE